MTEAQGWTSLMLSTIHGDDARERASRLREGRFPDRGVWRDSDIVAGADALDAIARVLDLHLPVTPGIYALSECWHCSDRSSDPVPWPCPTARAALGAHADEAPCPGDRTLEHAEGQRCTLPVNHVGRCIFADV